MKRTLPAALAAAIVLGVAACSSAAPAEPDPGMFGEPNFCDFYAGDGPIGEWMEASLDEADAAFEHLFADPEADDALDPMRAYGDRMRAEGPSFEAYVDVVADRTPDAAVAQEVRDLGAGLAALFNGFATAVEGAATADEFVAALDQDLSEVDGQTDRAVLDAYAATTC